MPGSRGPGVVPSVELGSGSVGRPPYKPPPIATVDAVLARRHLAEFVDQAWHVVEPDAPLVWNWHIDAICQHLEAVTEGKTRRLLINVPPGHMKSLLVCVFWFAWVWIRNPGWRALFGSYDMALSTRDSVRCRALLSSQWYWDQFHPQWRFRGDQNVKTYFQNTAGGLRQALSVTGAGTGFRGDAVIFDDPLNVKQNPTENDLEACQFWWDKRMSSRFNNPQTGVRVGIMQRLHEEDLSGHLITKGGYDHLCLPTEFDPERKARTSIGFEDPRTEAGELLFPQMYTPEVLAEAKEDLGSFQYAGQHNQIPVPSEGGTLKKHWLRFWYPQRTPPPAVVVQYEDKDGKARIHRCLQERLPTAFDRKISSSDLAFKDKKESDFVAMSTFGVLGAKRFWLDLIHDRLNFVQTLVRFADLLEAHPDCAAHLIEDKANGPALVTVLQDRVPGILEVNPQGSKLARTEACAPQIEAGNLYLPHPSVFPWVESLILELCTFPKSKNDDRLDTLTQALNWLRQSTAPVDKLRALTRM